MDYKIFGRCESLAFNIDHFTEWTGRAVSWMTLSMVLLTSVIVTLRYFFEIGSIALQESLTYMHAIVFLMGAAFTLKRKGHVNVDIFYQKFTLRTKAFIQILGTLIFLMPVCIVIFVLCWDYVMNSWAIEEASNEADGLPWVYLLKTLLLLMPVCLILQGFSELIKNFLLFAKYNKNSLCRKT